MLQNLNISQGKVKIMTQSQEKINIVSMKLIITKERKLVNA